MPKTWEHGGGLQPRREVVERPVVALPAPGAAVAAAVVTEETVAGTLATGSPDELHDVASASETGGTAELVRGEQ
jgi:hypothetical protein